MLNKVSIYFILTVLALFSCQRSVEKSQITFTMPGVLDTPVESNSLSAALGVLPFSTSVDTWRAITPTGLTGEHDLNCFFITVSAGDLNTYSCKNGARTSFSFGEITAPARAGASISVDVLQGEGRVFRLLGMHASSELDCYKFGKPEMKYENLSRPYVIGTTAPTNIGSSTTAISVPLQMTLLNLADSVDNCDWTFLSARAPPAASAVGDQLETVLDTGIFGGNYQQNKCLPVKVAFRENSTLLPALNTIAQPISLALAGNLNTPISTYTTAKDCLSGSSGATSFVAENQFSSTRWVPATLGGIPTLSQATINLGFAYGNNYSTKDLNFNVAGPLSAITVVPAALVNEFIYDGSCQPVSWVPRALDWSGATDFSAGGTSTVLQLSLTTPTTGTFGFFGNANCTGAPPVGSVPAATSISFANSAAALSVRTVYVKYQGFSAGTVIIHTISFIAPATVTYNSIFTSRVLPDRQTIANPVRLKISGPSNFPSSVTTAQSCVGPFKVATVDDNGVEIYMPLITYSPQISFTTNVVEVYRSDPTLAPCGGVGIPPGQTFDLGLASGRSSQLFYVRLQNPTVSPTTKYLAVSLDTITGQPILYRDYFALHFNVDGTAAASTASPPPCSGQGCIFRGL